MYGYTEMWTLSYEPIDTCFYFEYMLPPILARMKCYSFRLDNAVRRGTERLPEHIFRYLKEVLIWTSLGLTLVPLDKQLQIEIRCVVLCRPLVRPSIPVCCSKKWL